MIKTYVSWEEHNFDIGWFGGEHVKHIEAADLVIFTGGVDVGTWLYAERPHPKTQKQDDERDGEDLLTYRRAFCLKKPMLGICRGAQFLCVMAGGKLVQDIPKLSSRHTIDHGKLGVHSVTSDHHQEADPSRITDAVVFGRDPQGVVEDVYYRNINALGFQSHPEWEAYDSETAKFYASLVNRLVHNKLDQIL